MGCVKIYLEGRFSEFRMACLEMASMGMGAEARIFLIHPMT